MIELVPADRCTNMAEVRHAIDTLDRRIVAMLGERMRFIEAAARIKQDRDVVRDEARKADVIDKAKAAAATHDFPPNLVAEIYEVLVEGSIAHEMVRFDALKRT